MKITSWLGTRACVFSISALGLCWVRVSAGLMHTATVSVSSYVGQSCCVWNTILFLLMIYLLQFLQSFCLFFRILHGAMSENMMKTYHSGLNIPRIYIHIHTYMCTDPCRPHVCHFYPVVFLLLLLPCCSSVSLLFSYPFYSS